MASFVLLQPTVLESHVSVFREMFRLEKAKLVTFSILEASPYSVHIRTLLSTGRELIGQRTDRTSLTRETCSSAYLFTLNCEFSIFTC